MNPNDHVPNGLGFDLEHWHSAALLRDEVTDPVNHIVESVDIVLSLLRQHDTKATFFVVGELAAEYPGLISRIDREGHELGSHGHTHTSLTELTPAEFDTELRRSREAITDATSSPIVGFRAPTFSIGPNTSWAFDVLRRNDFEYDSSVFPVQTPMYGVPGSPRQPYAVNRSDPFSTHSRVDSELTEFPLSALGTPLRVPIAGGFYARVLPDRVLNWGVRRLNRDGIPANLYFHPWELNPAVPTDEPSFSSRLVSFYGIETLASTLERLLEQFTFLPLRELRDAWFPTTPARPTEPSADIDH